MLVVKETAISPLFLLRFVPEFCLIVKYLFEQVARLAILASFDVIYLHRWSKAMFDLLLMLR